MSVRYRHGFEHLVEAVHTKVRRGIHLELPLRILTNLNFTVMFGDDTNPRTGREASHQRSAHRGTAQGRCLKSVKRWSLKSCGKDTCLLHLFAFEGLAGFRNEGWLLLPDLRVSWGLGACDS